MTATTGDATRDTIEREITVKASKERVYKAISDQKEITKWFPDAVEGSLEPGSLPVFDFGEYGKNQVYVVAAHPHDYFAFRWIPGINHFIGDVMTQTTTLVEFRIEEVAGGTKVTLKESGFAAFGETGEERFRDNTSGWDYMIGRLETLMGEEG